LINELLDLLKKQRWQYLCQLKASTFYTDDKRRGARAKRVNLFPLFRYFDTIVIELCRFNKKAHFR